MHSLLAGLVGFATGALMVAAWVIWRWQGREGRLVPAGPTFGPDPAPVIHSALVQRAVPRLSEILDVCIAGEDTPEMVRGAAEELHELHLTMIGALEAHGGAGADRVPVKLPPLLGPMASAADVIMPDPLPEVIGDAHVLQGLFRDVVETLHQVSRELTIRVQDDGGWVTVAFMPWSSRAVDALDDLSLTPAIMPRDALRWWCQSTRARMAYFGGRFFATSRQDGLPRFDFHFQVAGPAR